MSLELLENSTFSNFHEISVEVNYDSEYPVFRTLDNNILHYIYNPSRLFPLGMGYLNIIREFKILGFFDKKNRLTFPSKESENFELTDLFGLCASNSYKLDFSNGRLHKDIPLIQINILINHLKSLSLSLSNILYYIYQFEFSKRGFHISKYPAFDDLLDSNTINSQARSICTLIDYVLRGFTLYQKNGYVDIDIMTMSTKSLDFGSINSTMDVKYVYSKNKCNIYYNFFDDQFMIYSGEYRVLFDYLINEEPNYYDTNFYNHDKKFFDICIKENILYLDNDVIKFVNKECLLLMRELKSNGFLVWHSLNDVQKNIVIDLKELDLLEFGNTFFSQQESDYFNYLFSDRYSNSLGIRNKFIHHSIYSNDENENYSAYLELLKGFISITLKIDIELNNI